MNTKYKSCPRCILGDIVKTQDDDGTYKLCIQCGYVIDPAITIPRSWTSAKWNKVGSLSTECR